jgi:hypothetical protein
MRLSDAPLTDHLTDRSPMPGRVRGAMSRVGCACTFSFTFPCTPLTVRCMTRASGRGLPGWGARMGCPDGVARSCVARARIPRDGRQISAHARTQPTGLKVWERPAERGADRGAAVSRRDGAGSRVCNTRSRYGVAARWPPRRRAPDARDAGSGPGQLRPRSAHPARPPPRPVRRRCCSSAVRDGGARSLLWSRGPAHRRRGR